MQNNQPLVSVIMNCYNSDRYLREAIESVINQTYKNFEIIFWDNQSTDDSAKIVKSYDDDRIKYFYAPTHTSLGEGRNLALEKVHGEFISFLDCDDLYMPNKIEETLKCFVDNKIGLVYTNGYTFFQTKQIKKPFYRNKQKYGNLFSQWILNYNLMIPSVMFKKEVIVKNNIIFDVRFSMIEEYDFFLKISKYSKIEYLNDKLCIWRAHESSLTWSQQDKFEIELVILKSKIINEYKISSNSTNIKKLEARIAYRKFLSLFINKQKIDRLIIQPYLNIDKRLYIIFFVSLFGKLSLNLLLRITRKKI